MKSFLLSLIFIFTVLLCRAQTVQVNKLPAGKYETTTKTNHGKWEHGDIILLSNEAYKVSTSEEVGEYKFSMAAQRIFFTSGPLKSFYAKTSLKNNLPVIVLPVSENEQAGIKLPAEIRGYYKH